MLLRVIYLEQGMLIIFLYCLNYGWIKVRSLYKSFRFPNSPAHFSCLSLYQVRYGYVFAIAMCCFRVTTRKQQLRTTFYKIPSRVYSQPGMREAGEVWTNRETREQNVFFVAREVHSRNICHKFESRSD